MRPFVRCLVFAALVLLAASAFTTALVRDEVTITTDRECYALGDTVTITVTNNLDSTSTMFSQPPWTIYEASTDSFVCCYVYHVIIYLAGHDSLVYEWPQIDYLLNPVQAGSYYVTMGYQDPSGLHTVSDTFEVGGLSSSEQTSWGHLKSQWR